MLEQRSRILPILLAVALIIATAGMAAAGDSPVQRALASVAGSLEANIDNASSIGGIVTQVDAQAHTITLLKRGGTVTVDVDADAAVVINGEAASLDEIRPRSTARLTLENRTAVRVEVRSSVFAGPLASQRPERPQRPQQRPSTTERPEVHSHIEAENEVTMVSGVVRHVDADARSLTVMGPNGLFTVRVAADAGIQINGEAARLSDLKPGAAVRLVLENRTVVRLQARQASPELQERPERVRETADISTVTTVSGTVRHVDLDNRILVVMLNENMVRLRVARDAGIVINGETSSLQRLQPGATVRLTLENRIIVRIEARQDSAQVESSTQLRATVD